MDWQSKNELLSGDKLVNVRKVDPSLLFRGQKQKIKECTQEEEECVQLFQDNLRQLISQERVDKTCNRSKGIWEPENNCVRIIRKEGNWNFYGFVKNQILFIETHEALYLMEMTRLELYFNSVIMSLEQAFSIFLTRKNSFSLEQYTVYSKLMNAGYIAFKFKSENHFIKDSKAEKDHFVWKIFFESLNVAEIQSPNNDNENKTFVYLKKSIESIKERTKNCCFTESEEEKLDFSWNIKTVNTTIKRKRKFEYSSLESNSFNDVLSVEQDMLEFRKIFDQIKIINLRKLNETEETNSRNLKFNFDLYLPNSLFKKSERGIPNYRLIVLRITDPPISALEISKLYQQQLVHVPMLVIIVSELMHFQAFIYNIATG